jgi:hypothetical protein
MKRVALGLLVLAGLAGPARAQDKFLCCDLDVGATSAACTGQADPCARTGNFSVQLSDVVPNSNADWAPGAQATIPDGQDGYLYWAAEQPFFGFCLVAPVLGDPTHQANPYVDPIGCLRVTLGPGISAEMLDVIVPADPRWDGYQWCYGGSDPVNGCQNLADDFSMAAAMTPSGSCCAPAVTFDQTTSTGKPEFGVNGDIPGVVPAQLVIQDGADGGAIVAYFNADPPDAEQIVSSADAGCLTVYGESRSCGSLPDGSPAPGAGNPTDADAPIMAATGPKVGCSVSGGRAAGWAAPLLAALTYLVIARRKRARTPSLCGTTQMSDKKYSVN